MQGEVSPALKRTRALAFFLALALVSAPRSAQAQNECTVTSTYSGLWTRAELNCGEPAGSKPRVAVVKSEALRTCPLLAGDRVSVTYLYDDPQRQPTVIGVVRRGDGGPSSGDWCGRGYAPSQFAAPCLVEEVPAREERKSVAGVSWVRTSVGTRFRSIDNYNVGVGPGACPPAKLEPGVYRIYTERSVWRKTLQPCANDPTRLCEETVYELERFEGGIYVDAAFAPSESVTDVRPLLRGWSAGSTEAVATSAAPLFRTTVVWMAGMGVGVPWVTTSPVRMAGIGVGVPWVVADTVKMAGMGGATTGNR